MGGRGGELDMAHPFPSYFCEGDLDAAFLADHAAVLQALVLAAQALVILDRPEDLGAEQAIALGLEGAVVDGLRLFHLAIRPRTDLLGRCEPDLDRVKLFFLRDLLEQIEQCFHSKPPVSAISLQLSAPNPCYVVQPPRAAHPIQADRCALNADRSQ